MIKLNNEIKYNVNLIVKTNLNSNDDLMKLFNEKLLKVIITLEKNKKDGIFQN